MHLGFPDSQEAVLAECRQEVLMGMVGQSYNILLMNLKVRFIQLQ